MNDPRKRIDKNHLGLNIIGAFLCVDAFLGSIQIAYRFPYHHLGIALVAVEFVGLVLAAVWWFRR
jgi:hypothetical protein